jgi:hypothetical protein
MVAIDPATWDRDHFRFAQSSFMWFYNAVGLIDAAAITYQSAVEQLARYEEATDDAFERAGKKLAEQPGLTSIVEPVDEFEPRFLPAFMMYGFAIENLLKGLLVLRNPSMVQDAKIGVPRTHNLTDLAKEAAWPTTSDENRLLGELSAITTWSGRYPVSLTLRDYTGLTKSQTIADRHAEMYAMTIGLIDKLTEKLQPEKDVQRGGMIVVERNST